MKEEPVAIIVPNEKLTAAIKAVKDQKRVGEFRIQFSQGSTSGTHKWIEKLPNGKSLLAVD